MGGIFARTAYSDNVSAAARALDDLAVTQHWSLVTHSTPSSGRHRGRSATQEKTAFASLVKREAGRLFFFTFADSTILNSFTLPAQSPSLRTSPT